MLKKQLLSFLVFSTIGLAANLRCDHFPVCWEGFYINGQLGMGSNQEHLRFTNPNYFNTIGPALVGNHFNKKTQGLVGGGALGFNYQSTHWVFGLEAGAVSTNLKNSRHSPFFPTTDRFYTQLQYIASGKARIGYAYDTLLTYMSGGWCGGEHLVRLEDTSNGIKAKSKTWTNGWTVGIGFDCKMAECYSMGLAYDYYSLRYGNKTTSCPNCEVGVGFGSPEISSQMYTQTLTVRLNYFFNL